MSKILIIGITGQDGTFLSDFLRKRGYEVFGTSRLPPKKSKTILRWDLKDSKALHEIFEKVSPDEVYNLAGFSTGTGMYEETEELTEINALSVVKILEEIRLHHSNTRFFHASSSEIFGEPFETPQNEKTAFNPRSPYGAAKLFGTNLIKIYRERYNLFCTSGILYNHESHLRTENFVTKKIVVNSVKVKLGMIDSFVLGNLEARRDWGYAGDFVVAMHAILQLEEPDDFIISTGKLSSVRQLCEFCFNYLDLDYRNHVFCEQTLTRDNERMPLVGDNSKIIDKTSWKPTLSIEKILQEMIDKELELNKGIRNDI
ncbi:GDP-mannose 4,6-dehydratase [Gammaproteobacteria bacterium]|nr:GDP-mannose 4,6-dehydratase [Gammaproteobacteria bacterium]